MGGIRGEAVAEVVAEPAKGRQDRLFLFSYIYRVRKVVGKKRVNKGLTL